MDKPVHATISGAYKTFSSVHEPKLKFRGDAKIPSEATRSSKSRNFGEGSPDFNEAKCEKKSLVAPIEPSDDSAGNGGVDGLGEQSLAEVVVVELFEVVARGAGGLRADE